MEAIIGREFWEVVVFPEFPEFAALPPPQPANKWQATKHAEPIITLRTIDFLQLRTIFRRGFRSTDLNEALRMNSPEQSRGRATSFAGDILPSALISSNQNRCSPLFPNQWVTTRAADAL